MVKFIKGFNYKSIIQYITYIIQSNKKQQGRFFMVERNLYKQQGK